MSDIDRADAHNRELRRTLVAARAGRGYVVTSGGRGSKLHAATSTTKGHGGFEWPRPLCQAATPSFYHDLVGDQTLAVTCQRCLTGLVKRNII